MLRGVGFIGFQQDALGGLRDNRAAITPLAGDNQSAGAAPAPIPTQPIISPALPESSGATQSSTGCSESSPGRNEYHNRANLRDARPQGAPLRVNVAKGAADGALVEMTGELHEGDREVRRASDELREGTSLIRAESG
jgi:hypothetical protein